MSDKVVEHKGVIKEIDKKRVRVNLVNVSACASCHAKGACTVADVDHKIIEVSHPKNGFYELIKGEEVKVIFENSLGFKALFFGYVLPFLFLITALLVSMELFANEGLAGLISIGVLVPYYAFLWFLRNHFRNTFTFKLEKI